MLLIPLVVGGKVDTRIKILVAPNLESVQTGQVTFGANVGE